MSKVLLNFENTVDPENFKGLELIGPMDRGLIDRQCFRSIWTFSIKNQRQRI